MVPRDISEGLWQDLAADSFHHNNAEYLLIADSFSKYPFLYKMSSKAADPIVKKMKSLISQYGSPKRLTTDNGLPFSLEAFKKVLKDHHIDHITSSPHYPKSSRFIECQIKTTKTALSTSRMAWQSIDLLLNIRSQPIGPHLPSHREILHNRTKDHPGSPSQPVDMEHIQSYHMTRKLYKKKTTIKDRMLSHYKS